MTASSTSPYLVTRREDGYGDVYPLQTGQRITLGRANSNRIILKDELCSREHAEVHFAEGRWCLREVGGYACSIHSSSLNTVSVRRRQIISICIVDRS